MTAGSYQAMRSSDVPRARVLLRPFPGAARFGLPLLLATLALLPAATGARAQFNPDQKPPIAQLATPETDRDTARQEAADERVAAFLISEAREELELGELRSARRRLEILVTRYAATSVAPRARRLLEQLALIDGYPIPPMPKGTRPVEPAQSKDAGGGSLAAHTPGTSLIEADFSASGGDRLFFADGSDEVGGRGSRILREKAAWLQRHAQVFVRIEGHADDFGNDDFNNALALRRAETVRDQLVEAGVPATRMHIAAFGRESRVSPCTAPGCAAQNRRAVLVLTDARGSRLSTSSKQAARDGASPAVAPGRSGAPSRRDR